LLHVGKSSIPGISRKYPYGVYAKVALKASQTVGHYDGEELTAEELKERYPADDGRYTCQRLDGSFIDAVDPTLSTVGRFINCPGIHQTPNVAIEEDHRGRLYIETLRSIGKGEELLYDYGEGYAWDPRERKDSAFGAPEVEPHIEVPSQDFSEEKKAGKSMDLAKVEDLQEDSMVLYYDIGDTQSSSSSMDKWILASVTAVDPGRQVIEAQRYGSYQHDRGATPLGECQWFPRATDPRDGKDVDCLPKPALSRLQPVMLHIPAGDVFVYNFYLTNKHRLPPQALKMLKD
jgi:hypothetical protein